MEKPELEADSRVDDNDLIHVGNIEFRVIATPGHTKGGLCLYSEKENLVFTGDTLFKKVIGRTDLPTGSNKTVVSSLKKKTASSRRAFITFSLPFLIFEKSSPT